MAILDVQDVHTYYGDAYVLQGSVAAARTGPDPRSAWAQRRRQDYARELHRRLRAATPRQNRFQGRRHHRSIPRLPSCAAAWDWCRRAAAFSYAQSVEDNLASRRTQPRRATAGTSSGSMRCSRGCASASISAPRRCPAASSKCCAIGRGLMTNPDCLIMDEPSEGLAPIIIQGLWEAIIAIAVRHRHRF